MIQNKEHINCREFEVQSDFEELYIEVRKSENRIYTNEEVKSLPEIDKNNKYHKEWELRKRSAIRLINHIKSQKRPLRILEVGCGNGWLSSKLAEIDNTKVTGMDLNIVELKQAIEVFGDKPNLNFLYGTITDNSLRSLTFDLIIFAASIQYFPSIRNIINYALSILNKDGEIHILDTHFYKENEISVARQRSVSYFANIGHDRMAQYYFHHSLQDLAGFRYNIKYNPKSLLNQLLKDNPFYWISIKN